MGHEMKILVRRSYLGVPLYRLLLSALLAALVIVAVASMSLLPRPPVLVNRSAEWPDPIRRFAEDALDNDVVHSLYRVSEFNYYLSIQTTSRESCDFLASSMEQRWSLQKVDRGNMAVMLFFRQFPENILELSNSELSTFYVSPGWLRGDEGHLYVLARSVRAELVLWYSYNF